MKGWHRDPFGIHHERYFYGDEQPGRLVRDVEHHESFDDVPENGGPPNRVSGRASEARLRVLTGAGQTPAVAPPDEPWLTASAAGESLPLSLDHADRWIDPPAHGWIHRFHEFRWPRRRLLLAVGASGLAIVVLAAVLITSSSSPPATGRLKTTQPNAKVPPPRTTAPPTTTVPVTLHQVGWQISQTFAASSLGLAAVDCPVATGCEAVGETTLKTGMVLSSSDQGSTWTQQKLPNGIGPLSSISCASARSCVAVGGITVITTSDGGTSWSVQLLKAQNLNAVSCPSVTVCVAAGVFPSGSGCDEGVTYITTNGGRTWSSMFVPCFDPHAISCPSVADCELVGTKFSSQYQYGEVLGSADGGAWKEQFTMPGPNSQLNGVACPSTTMCEAAGSGTSQLIVGTDDGGTTWTNQSIPLMNGINSFSAVTCLSPQVCQASGMARAIGTENGGTTWAAQPLPPVVSNLTAVSCPAAGICVGVGDAGDSGVALRFDT
jgi:photosystem II stability/assembly factor-like uncharacterized protein